MYSYYGLVLFLRGDPNYEVVFLTFDLGTPLLGEESADPPPPATGRTLADIIPPIPAPIANYLVLALRPNPDEFFATLVAIVVETGFELIGFFLLGAKAT